MKFLVSKDLHSNPNFTLLLGFYALFMVLYFCGDLFYLAHFFGSKPEAVLLTLKGNPEEFSEPLSLLSLLEHLHVSLFLGILSLFTTLAIILRLNLRNRHKGFIILISMGSLLLASFSLLGTYFIVDAFVYPFFFLTLLWHLSGAYALLLALTQLWFKKA